MGSRRSRQLCALQREAALVVRRHADGIELAEALRLRDLRHRARRAAPLNARALIKRLHREDQVVRVGDHHVGDLVERLAAHVDAIHLDDLVVNCEQATAFGETAGHEPRDKDGRQLLQAIGRDANRSAVSDVEAERLVAAVFHQPHAHQVLGNDADVDD